MLKLQGMPRNIKRPLLGRVSSFPVAEKERSQTVLLNPALPEKEVKEYTGALFSSLRSGGKAQIYEIPIVCDVQGIESLSEGDIVEIFPDGTINVLYQLKSRHNVIFVTSKCDCHCIMCPQPVDDHEQSLTGLNLRLISLMSKSTEEIGLTGGEPTLVGEDLFKLVLACRDLLPDTSLLLLTNGRKFSNFDYAHFFSSLRHPNLTIGIPLYGDNDIEHDTVMGSKGAFDETVRGIINLASFSHPIEIRTVIHKFTYNKLPRIAEFVYRNFTFTRHIAFMGLETIWRARERINSLWVDPADIVWPLAEAIHFLAQRGMNASIYNIPLCLLPNHLWGFSRKSISEWKDDFGTVCAKCSVKENCSGVFSSALDVYGRNLKPIP